MESQVKENQAKTLEKPDQKQHSNGHGMVSLAEKVKQYHTQPVPEAGVPVPQPFPPLLRWGLGVGILVGALLGLLFGALLFNGTLVIRGWEGIFSLVPFTFHFFWTMIGAAAGLVLGGVGALLVAKPQPNESVSATPTAPDNAS